MKELEVQRCNVKALTRIAIKKDHQIERLQDKVAAKEDA